MLKSSRSLALLALLVSACASCGGVAEAGVTPSSTYPDAPYDGARLANTAAQTIAPGTDRATRYILGTTLSQNSVVTVSVTSMESGQLSIIERKAGTGSNTLTVTNGGVGGGSYVFPVVTTRRMQLSLYYNGVDVTFVGLTYLR